MKILALSASPRRHSNSAELVDELLAAAQQAGAETERVDLNPLNIRGCQGDLVCKWDGRCCQPDDMQAIYDKIDAADAVVFASPVYGFTVSAQLKAVLDRLFAYLNKDLSTRIAKTKKSALIVTQANDDEDLFLSYLSSVPKVLEMTGFGKTHLLLGAGLSAPGVAAQRPDLVQRAREIGRQLTLP